MNLWSTSSAQRSFEHCHIAIVVVVVKKSLTCEYIWSWIFTKHKICIHFLGRAQNHNLNPRSDLQSNVYIPEYPSTCISLYIYVSVYLWMSISTYIYLCLYPYWFSCLIFSNYELQRYPFRCWISQASPTLLLVRLSHYNNINFKSIS